MRAKKLQLSRTILEISFACLTILISTNLVTVFISFSFHHPSPKFFGRSLQKTGIFAKRPRMLACIRQPKVADCPDKFPCQSRVSRTGCRQVIPWPVFEGSFTHVLENYGATLQKNRE
jgi:hypothetical protein